MILRLITLILLLAVSAGAQSSITKIIPLSSLPATGSYQNIAGVPGGIDQYSTNYTIFCNVRVSIPGTTNVAYGDGIHDDTTALQFAVNNAPNGSVVYIPAGTYLLTGTLQRQNASLWDGRSYPYSIIIRGDGMGKTVLLNDGGGSAIMLVNNSGWANLPIAGTNYSGATNILLSGSMPGVPVGSWMLVSHDDTAANVYHPPSNDPNPYYYTYGNASAQFVKITGMAGNTITFWPPLNEGYTNDTLSMSGQPPFRSGIENLTVVQMQDITAHNIRIINGQECWIRNVESRQARSYHISLEQCGGCEVSGCYVHDPFPYKDGNTGGGSSDYGITLGFHSSSCLVEDNIALHCRHSFILETGAGQDNVIAYNYGKDNLNESLFETDYQMDTHYHGGEPRYDLWEGNVIPIIRADAVEGATKYDIYFRNLVTRDGLAPVNVAVNAMDIQRGNYYDYFLANVYQATNTVNVTGPMVYRLGSWEDTQFFPGTTNVYDPMVIVNDVWLGNYDFSTGLLDQSTNGVINWEKSISANLPASLYYSSKPAWYSNNLSWPPFGFDIAGYTNLIPAQLRAMAMPGFANTVSDGFILTLQTNGSGTATTVGNQSYYNGAWIMLSATPAPGYSFAGWSGYPVANSNLLNNYLVMPAANITVTANFVPTASYALKVSNGNGSGSFAMSSLVTINAAAAPSGSQFAYWQTSLPVSINTNSPTITLVMPSANLVLTAIYTPIIYYTLTVNGGYSDAGTSVPANTQITISADTPPSGKTFNNWTGYSVANAYSGSTTFTMPAANVSVTANYTVATGNLPDQTVTKGLVAWWKLSEGSGTNLIDSSGNGNDGYLIGLPLPAWVPGKYGKALQFDGIQNYAIGGTKNEPVNSNFSVSYWADLPANPAGTIVSTWENSSYRNNWYVNWNSAAVSGIIGGPYNTAGVCNISWTNVPVGSWHHFVLTVNFFNKQAAYYIDSVLVATNFSYGFNNLAPTLPNALAIGSAQASSANSLFNGALNDLRIYNRIISTAEIQTIYAGQAQKTVLTPPFNLSVQPH